MPWFQVDDGFHAHPKVFSLSMAAVGVWVLGGSWSARYLTDGAVPAGMVTRLGGSPEHAAELVAAGLWSETPEGFQFHEWEKVQPLKADVEAERAAARERMRAVRAKRKGVQPHSEERSPEQVPNVHGDVQGNGAGTSAEVLSALTIPSHSIPREPSNEGSGGPRKRGTRIPDPFVVTADMRAWAADRTPLVDVNGSTERFVNHWRAKAGKDATKLDWVATWRNWLIRDNDDRQNRRLTPMERAAQTAAAGRRAAAPVGREVGGVLITSLEPKELAS